MTSDTKTILGFIVTFSGLGFLYLSDLKADFKDNMDSLDKRMTRIEKSMSGVGQRVARIEGALSVKVIDSNRKVVATHAKIEESAQ